MIKILIINTLFLFLGLFFGCIIGVYAITSSICIDMLRENDFKRILKAVKKRLNKEIK